MRSLLPDSPFSLRRPGVLLLPLVLLLAFPAGCKPAERAGEPSLVLYSGRAQALVQPVVDAFMEETGIRVRVNYADTSQLAATLLEEGARSPADLFLAQDAATLGLLEEEGLLAPLPESLQEQVHAYVRSRRHSWVGVSARARVLAYNPDRVAPQALPSSLDALTTEPWRGRVGWAPTNASFQAFLGAMIELQGEEEARRWVEAMVANGARVYPANTPLVLAVSSGEVDVALTNHYYRHRLQAEQGDRIRVENHYFRDGGPGSMVSVSAIGILATSGKGELAERFISFLLSERAQGHFAEANFEFPLALGAEAGGGLPQAAELGAPELDLSGLATLERSVRLLRATGAMP